MHNPEKTALKLQIERLDVSIKGWRKAPVEYLEDIVAMLQRLEPADLQAVKHITLIPWYWSLRFWLGILGHVGRGSGRINAVIMPSRPAFQWVFAHELGHVVVDSHPEVRDALARSSWRLSAWNQMPALCRIAIGLELFLVFYIVAVVFQAPLWLVMLGVIFCAATGGITSRMLMLLSGQPVHVYDCTKPWKVLTPYSLVSVEEHCADLFAAYMVLPDRFRKKAGYELEYRIISQLFGGREFGAMETSWVVLSRERALLLSFVAHAWLIAALATTGWLNDAVWLLFKLALLAAVITAGVLYILRPVVSLGVSMPVGASVVSSMTRQAAASFFGVLQESLKMMLPVVLLVVLLNPFAMRFDFSIGLGRVSGLARSMAYLMNPLNWQLNFNWLPEFGSSADGSTEDDGRPEWGKPFRELRVMRATLRIPQGIVLPKSLGVAAKPPQRLFFPWTDGYIYDQQIRQGNTVYGESVKVRDPFDPYSVMPREPWQKQISGWPPLPTFLNLSLSLNAYTDLDIDGPKLSEVEEVTIGVERSDPGWVEFVFLLAKKRSSEWKRGEWPDMASTGYLGSAQLEGGRQRIVIPAADIEKKVGEETAEYFFISVRVYLGDSRKWGDVLRALFDGVEFKLKANAPTTR